MQVVLSVAGAKALDARLARAGLLDLAMEEAGRAGADAAQQLVPKGQVLLLAGGGANGGDALVAARHLLALGREVTILALPAKHTLTRLNRQRLKAVGCMPLHLTLPILRRELQRAAVLIDGLLGTGFHPPLRPTLAEIIGLVNAAQKPVLALDLPSGLQAEVAAIEAESIVAQATVTFSGFKTALLFGLAARSCGQVYLADLRLPPEWVLEQALATRPAMSEVAALLPVRPADAHKGMAGSVWVIGGYPGTAGAASLAGLAALRAGAGLVTIYSTADVPLVTPELMVQQHADLLVGLRQAGKRPNALCVGMGLGPQAPEIAREVLGWRLPTVLDADALQPDLAGLGHAECIWTPHPGEAARLLGVSTPDITRDPLSAARAIQQKMGGTVVLKGGPSVIATAEAGAAGLQVSRGGHSGMAKAGMGDTLSGILAALLGQGLSAAHAALAGVTLHARAGELAAQQYGYGLLASDVSRQLGAAWQEMTQAH